MMTASSSAAAAAATPESAASEFRRSNSAPTDVYDYDYNGKKDLAADGGGDDDDWRGPPDLVEATEALDVSSGGDGEIEDPELGLPFGERLRCCCCRCKATADGCGRGIVSDFNRTLRKHWFEEMTNLDVKVVAVSFFLFFACVAPAVTFGAIYAKGEFGCCRCCRCCCRSFWLAAAGDLLPSSSLFFLLLRLSHSTPSAFPTFSSNSGSDEQLDRR